MNAKEPVYPCKIRKYGHDFEYSGITAKDHMMIEFAKAILSGPEAKNTIKMRRTLGMQEDEPLDYDIHYPAYVAKMASLYADAAIKESNC